MDVLFRRCTEADLDVLRELSIRTFYETFAHMNSAEEISAYLEDAFAAETLRNELNCQTSGFYFLYVDGTLAGYLKWNEAPSQTDLNDPASLEIQRIYVSKEFQGSGLGTYLIDQAVRIAVEKKKEFIWLGVWEKNEKAIRFYKKNGFYKAGTHAFFVGGDQQTDHIMRRDLQVH